MNVLDLSQMEILYASTLCSERKIESLISTGMVAPQLAVQKFHQLLTKGLVYNNCKVETISSRPVGRFSQKKIFWKKEIENLDGVKFEYLPFINFPLLRQSTIFFFGFVRTTLWILKHKRKNCVIMCDVLNVAVSVAALTAARLFNVHAVGIVTDLPGMIITHNDKKIKLLRKLAPIIYKAAIHSYTSYVMLTKSMNSFINPRNRPYCIIEGMVDINMKTVEPQKEKSCRNIIYAGSLYEVYGVKQLIEAFRKVKGDDLRLSIYGSGEMDHEMENYIKRDSRIHYYGSVANAEVIKAELSATLLVNPRFTDAEYTKYSFPSKNMEYMVSGVPVLTTCLPGMPIEYYEHIYMFDNETINGFIKTLTDVLSLSDEELELKGKAAKEFVLLEKNNIYQSGKILEMIISNNILS